MEPDPPCLSSGSSSSSSEKPGALPGEGTGRTPAMSGEWRMAMRGEGTRSVRGRTRAMPGERTRAMPGEGTGRTPAMSGEWRMAMRGEGTRSEKRPYLKRKREIRAAIAAAAAKKDLATAIHTASMKEDWEALLDSAISPPAALAKKDLRATETHTGIGTGTMKTDCWIDLVDWNDFPPAALAKKDLRATETHTGIGTGTMKTDCWKDLLDWNDFPPAAVSITTPPLPARYPPFPRDEEDPHEDLPDTGDVISSRDKTVVQDVARSVVTVVYHYKDDEDIMRQRLFTGFVIDRGGTQKHFRVFTCCTAIRSSDPEPKLQIRLIDMSVLEAKLLFFDAHYDVALLEILQESHLLEVSSFGAKPSYGQEVFVVGRDIESKLIAKRGSIEWLEETDYLGRHCHLFLSCEFSWYGRGGPVTDLDGCVIGMILETDRQNPPMLAMSTIATFMRMWMDYSFITRPMHGLRLRTVELLDVSLRENLSVIHKINNGYFVDEVSVSSTAESLGITSGEVIISIDNHPCYTLPKFENFLLFRGVDSLQTADSSLRCMVCVKLEVYNRVGHKTRAINLPVGFSVS